jgi:RNA polymerase sigma-70 factor (ECF subfamily)
MDEFEKVYRKNQTKWLRVIQRIVKNPADAEDILQDALCRALSNMDKYNPSRGTYNTWFTQVLFSELKDWMRRNKKNEKNFPIEYYDEAIDYTSFVESRLSLLQRI